MKNIEIKAKCPDPVAVDDLLRKAGADFKGIDRQIDTYFNVNSGRLKTREGTIENALIQYNRPNQNEAKRSDFILYHSMELHKLKEVLKRSIGVKIVVDKKRKIYYIGKVKFHIDEVKDLGNFLEIEVTDMDEKRSVEEMNASCEKYMEYLGVKPDHLIALSYSDMMLQKINEES